MKVFDQDIQPDRRHAVLPSLKIILGLILLLALISQDPLDPGPLNLLRPAAGIGNIFGLPGALIAGALFDCLGICGYLLPLSLILLKHDDRLKVRQIFLLDFAMMILLTVALAQLPGMSDDSHIGMAGMLGQMSELYLQAFPGKLIVLLIVTGILFQYGGYYRFNSQSYVMVRHSAGFVMLAAVFIREILGSRLEGVRWKMDGFLAPLSNASRERLTSISARSAGGWKAVAEKTTGWFLELNPFYRFYDGKAGIPGTAHLDEKGIQELEQRKLLSRTIEEFERRSSGERR